MSEVFALSSYFCFSLRCPSSKRGDAGWRGPRFSVVVGDLGYGTETDRDEKWLPFCSDFRSEMANIRSTLTLLPRVMLEGYTTMRATVLVETPTLKTTLNWLLVFSSPIPTWCCGFHPSNLSLIRRRNKRERKAFRASKTAESIISDWYHILWANRPVK